MKVVFHVDELTKLSEARHNIKNLLTADKNATIVLVVNGEAIQGYLLPAQVEFMKECPKVSYHACNNAMNAYHIAKEDLVEAVEVVPAGVMDLVRLQHEGFAYIKP